MYSLKAKREHKLGLLLVIDFLYIFALSNSIMISISKRTGVQNRDPPPAPSVCVPHSLLLLEFIYASCQFLISASSAR